ncbi:hypothetical protein AS590_22980 [Prescottella equi]|uniref:phage antirepressor KilAC domain-containing protein n=1 Tax=Rhodococcus qingshengii TaxID=334542 RepID=UPI0007E57A6E|nr:phage antirepressor KilAC domain-containing protein [Rhodococcus qingshengii]OCC20822.1 hypothetical protein AS590_22980 [Prescottella equi]BCF84567.1 hypothetical protein RQCS_41120 [Rhodococcus qingshengii]
MSDLNLFNPDESPFDSIRQVHPDGSEFWSARDLMPLLGYEKWERFEDAIDRAVDSMRNSGQDPMRNASRRREAIAKTARTNWHLSRFACYLVAMNGDPRKSEVAAAQAYFAIRTREAETAPAAVTELSRLDILKLAIAAEEEKAELQSQVAVMAPKADYVDTYVTDNDLMKLRTIAANLNVGETWLRDKLVEKNWIYFEEDSRWSHSKQCKEVRKRYSASSEKRAYFRPVEEHRAPRFRGETMHTLKVTPRGATAIANVLPRWTKEAAA